MTRAPWAERKVEGLEFIAFMNNGEVPVCESKDVVKALLAEHKRAVRVVTREIERVKKDKYTYRSEERCLILGSLETVLKALQKGRT